MKYDVAVVLSHELEGRELSEQSKRRVQVGVGFYKDKLAENLLMSGEHKNKGKKYKITLAQAMAKYAFKFKVPKKHLFKEELSLETVGQLIFSKLIIDKKKWKNILVISHDYHRDRVVEIISVVFDSNYKVDFAEVKSRFDFKQKEEIMFKEGASKEIFKKTFQDVEPGNNRELLDVLLGEHEIYKKEPEYFLEKLEKLRLLKSR